ncbi:hypothetical protein [Euryhalocaulis caribicus]|uniref:hypothetical protein n=1 Tax=Euryhalocaulis caribicus TaxID=1161401 RepID=UPI001268EDA8|nr:hypothetical protein [Euryhalocaulis caribicus]
MAASNLSEDENLFVSALKKFEGYSVNTNIQKELRWSDERYDEVKTSLIEKGMISKARGRGGAVRLSSELSELPSKKKKSVRETDLYKPMLGILNSWLRNEIGYSERNFISEVCGNKRHKGYGRWSQPDLIAAGYRSFQYLVPGKYLDIISFEVKTANNFDMTGVYEAAAHLRYVNYSYLIINDEISSWNKEDLESLKNECERIGIGLIESIKPDDKECWEIHVKALFQTPDPQLADDFIRRNFSDKSLKQIAELI